MLPAFIPNLCIYIHIIFFFQPGSPEGIDANISDWMYKKLGTSVLKVPTYVPAVKNHPVINRACLFIAIIYALNHIRKERKEGNCYTSLMRLYHKDEESQKVGLRALLRKFNEATDNPAIRKKGAHNYGEAHEFLKKEGAQVHVFELVQGKTNYRYSIPPNLDLEKEQIYLLESTKNGLLHVDYLQRPSVFFNKMGKYCLFCHKHYAKGSYRPICKAKPKVQCSFCRRPFLKKNMKIHPSMKKDFCTSLQDEISLRICENKCNMISKSQNCRDGHRVTDCRRQWRCLKCNNITSLNGGADCHKIAEEEHKCWKVKCGICKSYKKKGTLHDCKLWKRPLQKEHPLIGTISMAFANRKTGDGVVLEPNYLVSMSESKNKGKFSKIEVNEWNGLSFESNIIEKKYWPEDMSRYYEDLKATKLRTQDYIAHASGQNVVFDFLKYIINEKAEAYYGTTFMCQNPNEVTAIASELTKFNLSTPKITPKGSSIIYIYIKERKLVFSCYSNYSQSKKGSKTRFFPWNWNDRQHEEHDGPVPPDEAFIQLNDSEEERVAKQSYSGSFPLDYSWNFKSELQHHMCAESEELLEEVLGVFQDFNYIEKKCKVYYQPILTKGALPYISPFHKDLITGISTIFYLYKLYFLHAYDVRGVR